MMETSENFSLRWNDFESNVSGSFREMRSESDFFDCTLACDESEGRTLQAHKVILSACSSFFKQMFRNMAASAPGHPNPLIYLRGVRLMDLESVLDFMYHGEVNVAQDDLNSFLAIAEDLQIKGLAQQSTKACLVARKCRVVGRKSSSSASAGTAAKRVCREQTGIDDGHSNKVKNEPTGFDDVSPSTSGAGESFTVETAGSYDGASGGIAYGNDVFDDGYKYGNEGGDAPGDVSALMDQSMAGGGGNEMQDKTKAVTDLNELVLGLLTYSDGIHMCNLCGKKSPWRTTMLRHVEANHVETSGHVCDVCGQVSKTRHAFAMHKKRKHKVDLINELLLPGTSNPRPATAT